MRPAVVVLVLAAALAAGCGHARRVLTPSDHRACESFAGRVSDPGTTEYRDIVRVCLRDLLHPERGGG